MLVLLVVLSMVIIPASANVTRQHEPFVKSRQGKFLSFNTDEKGVEINLSFEVPFITIPVKRAVDMTKGVMANINVAALAFSGLLTLLSTVLVPALTTLLGKKFGATAPSFKTKGNNTETEGTPIWRTIDDTLRSNGLDLTTCTQRALCRTIRRSSTNVRSGKAGSNDKILEGLATNDWLRGHLHLYPQLEVAVVRGLAAESTACGFKGCAMSQRALASAVKGLGKVLNELL